MKTRWSIFALLLVSCTALFNPFRGTINQDTKKYYSDSLEISLQIPDRWHITQVLSDSSIGFLFPPDDRFRPLIAIKSKDKRAVVRVVASVKPTSLSTFLSTFTTTEVSRFLSSAYWWIDGNDSAAVIEYRRASDKGQTYLFREFCFVQKGHLIRLQCGSLAAAFAGYEPLFSDIIQGMQFGSAGAQNNFRWRTARISSSDIPIVFLTKSAQPSSIVDYDEVCVDSSRSTCWKIVSPSTVVYLLGSIHLALPEMYPLKNGITDAFSSSDVLVVEVNTHKSDMKRTMREFLPKMFYRSGSIKQHIDANIYARLKIVCKKLGVSLYEYSRFQPWILSMSLSLAQLEKLGVSGTYGIDEYFLKCAEKKGVEIQELETAKSQLSLLYESCNSPQYLEYTLNDIDKMELFMVPLIGAWKCGNTGALEKLTFSPEDLNKPQYRSFIEMLIYQRNIDFTRKIEQYLKGQQTCFIIFGAAHMVGDKGVIELLKRKGFFVEQL